MKALIAILVLTGFTLTMVGCNTTEGFGKDTKNAGQSIQNAAENNK